MMAPCWRLSRFVRRLRLAILTLAALIGVSATSVAQSAATAPITGVVVDPTGSVLPNAAVELTTPSGAVIQSRAANATGTFAFDAVPAGRYAVHVSLDQFQPAVVAVTVGARATRPLKIALALAGVHQEITVVGGAAQVATSAAANADAISVTQSTLETLPIFDDDAVATISRFLDVGSVGTSGPTILVNGMEVNSLNVSTSAIQQIKINQDPYSAAFSRPGRGRIDILTKPGSADYHGDANLIFRDATLNARNAFATTRPPEQRRIGDGFVGGPVGDGTRTSFMASIKDDSEDRQAFVFAAGPDGTIRDNVAQPFRHLLVTVGVTHQAGDSTISIRPSYEQQTDAYRGVGGTTLASAGTTYYHRETDLTYNQQTVVRPTLLNQFQILVGQELEPTTSVSPAPGLVVNGAFTGGGAQVDLRRTELHFQLSENVALTHGSHLLQLGFQVPDWSRRGFYDQSGFGGTYYFGSLTAYATGTPYAFVQQRGNGTVVWLEKVLGVYANDDWQIRPDTTLSFGLRYDWSNYFADHDNLAPRFSMAVKPAGASSTVLRGGAGLFYDKVGPFPVIDVLDFRPGGLDRIVLSNPSYPNPFLAGSVAAAPPSTAQFAPGIQIPWTLQYSGGLEQQLTKTTTLSIMYYGSHGTLLRSRDLNAPLPPLYAARPNPDLGVVRQIDSSARQVSDSLQVTLRGRISRFNGQLQYALSRTMNESGGLNWYPANDYDLSGEWARADFDRRHRLIMLGSVSPGRRFTLGAVFTLQSGLPYSETLGTDPFNNGRGNARPPGVPRNSLESAGSGVLDVRVSRDVVVTRGPSPVTVTVGLDAFNLLNQVNYATYVGTLTSSLFGQPVTALPPRQLQLSARVKF